MQNPNSYCRTDLLCLSCDYSCAPTPPHTHAHTHSQSLASSFSGNCRTNHSGSGHASSQLVQSSSAARHLPSTHSFSLSHISSSQSTPAQTSYYSSVMQNISSATLFSFLILHLSSSSCCHSLPFFHLYSWAAGVYQHDTGSLTFITIRVNVSVCLCFDTVMHK